MNLTSFSDKTHFIDHCLNQNENDHEQKWESDDLIAFEIGLVFWQGCKVEADDFEWCGMGFLEEISHWKEKHWDLTGD